MTDGTTLLFGLPGFRVLSVIFAPDGGRQVHVESIEATDGCPSCVVLSGRERPPGVESQGLAAWRGAQSSDYSLSRLLAWARDNARVTVRQYPGGANRGLVPTLQESLTIASGELSPSRSG